MVSILIADDSPPMRTLLRLTLHGGDHDVVEARDGVEALALLAAHRPVVAVLDVTMPGRTGLEVCSAVRADPTLASMGLVVISANGLESDARMALAAGANRFLSKPFSPRRLLETVTTLAADLSGPGSQYGPTPNVWGSLTRADRSAGRSRSRACAGPPATGAPSGR